MPTFRLEVSMRVVAIRIALAGALVGAGWAIGRAQGTVGDFTLTIDAPVGVTNVRCTRGCTLQGGRDAGNPNNIPVPDYQYSCRGASVRRCGATVNGFMSK
jgi:hypothetical protein